jgi:hypothetical protein
VLVHCNGACQLGLIALVSSKSRWYKPVPCIRGDVCHATSTNIMGRCTTYGPESEVLHIPKWRVFNSDQSMYPEVENNCVLTLE